MRPIKLEMTAFGAYVKKTIVDFESGLRDEKIFLINGATGAGKTTILDAISYALYGETSGKARDGKDMRSKGVSDDVATVVEFTFALGDKIFRALRVLNYNSRRKENKYQTQAALFCNGNLIETKDRAVTKTIKELLGFDAEQFRQVVLLPQGEFKKFLSADSDKRQEVLNILFDSTAYKKVEEALAERAKTSATVADELKRHCEGLEKKLSGADSSSLAELEEKLSLARKKVAEFKKIFDKAQADFTEGKLLAAKFADLQRLTSTLNAAQIQFDEAEKVFAAAQAEYQKRKAEELTRKKLEEKIRELKEIQSGLSDWGKKKSELEGVQEKLSASKKKFTDYDGKAKQYEVLLAELETKRLELVGADVEFEKAKQLLKQAKDKAKLLSDIAHYEKILSMEQEKLAVLEKKLATAQIELERLQIVDNAARLVSKLKDGEPCPVCGSREHPAITKAAIPTVAELQSAEKNVERLNKEQLQQTGTVRRIAGELAAKKEQLDTLTNVPDVATAQKKHDAAQKNSVELGNLRQRIENGNVVIKENKRALDAADKEQKDAQSKVDKLIGAISDVEKKIPEEYLTDSSKLKADLSAAEKSFDELDVAWNSADENHRKADKAKSARKSALDSAQKNFDALQDKLKDKTPPDINSLEQKAKEAQNNYVEARDEKAKLETTYDAMNKDLAELEKVRLEFADKQKIADMWRRLSDVANATGKGESALKISFQRYFLSTMFNDVVTEANNRLKKMSNGRYLFQIKDAGKTKAKSAGLNLEIFDEQTGALRPVETLSGGESFLASLSLALGLASVVRNKVGGIKLDTIFIDEGFGSLDSETLDFAISTIIEQSGGRLVGIISHVEELKNQMPVRLEVTKTKTGSTAKFIS